MSNGGAFLTGFLKQTNKNINERKDEAREYFNQRMQQAFESARSYKARNKDKLDSSLQVGKQLMAAGVPQDVVMAIANQNPEDLATFQSTIDEMKVKGVEFTPESYRGLVNMDKEFNAGSENLTSLLQKIYTPLMGNIKADPQGWDFDPKGTMWATMMGYNAMERANERLASTEVLPGVSAAEVLGDTGSPNYNPLNSGAVSFNYNEVGNKTREAAKTLKGPDDLSITEVTNIRNEFEKAQESVRLNMLKEGVDATSLSPEDVSRQAARIIQENYPRAVEVPEVNKWLGEAAPESPGEAPTEPVANQATTLPAAPSKAASGLPTGSRLVKEFPNGDKGYLGPDGKKFIVKGSSKPVMQETPKPGWLENLGSEYD